MVGEGNQGGRGAHDEMLGHDCSDVLLVAKGCTVFLGVAHQTTHNRRHARLRTSKLRCGMESCWSNPSAGVYLFPKYFVCKPDRLEDRVLGVALPGFTTMSKLRSALDTPARSVKRVALAERGGKANTVVQPWVASVRRWEGLLLGSQHGRYRRWSRRTMDDRLPKDDKTRQQWQ
jgi:hypothetical protein